MSLDRIIPIKIWKLFHRGFAFNLKFELKTILSSLRKKELYLFRNQPSEQIMRIHLVDLENNIIKSEKKFWENILQ